MSPTLKSTIEIMINILDQVVTLIMVLSLLGFIIGMIRFIYSAGDERGRAAGKKTMVWGTLALTVMVAVWGIVSIINTTFFG